MTTWSRSFTLALRVILVGIGFAIIGVAIMVIGIGLAYIGLRSYYLSGGAIGVNTWIGIALAIIGFSISSIGFYAALIKYTVDEAVNEARGPALSLLKTQSGTSVRTCPNCRTPLVWIEQEKRWYCPKDREYIP